MVLGKREDIFKIAEKAFKPTNSEFTSHHFYSIIAPSIPLEKKKCFRNLNH
jgi:hypothetical protein